MNTAGEKPKKNIGKIIGVVVTGIGLIAAVLAIPGMPKLFHWDSEKPPVQTQSNNQPTEDKPRLPAPKPVQKTRDVSSGQVNFGCEQELGVDTPPVYFGKNPRNIDAKPGWVNTDNVKTQSSPTIINVENPVNHQAGIKASGTLRGRDKDTILGVKNCPGGGHGELTLHVTWTEDEQ
jgi:hypothetical protein